MVLWLKLGKLIVIGALKAKWIELVILSLGQASVLDYFLVPTDWQTLKAASAYHCQLFFPQWSPTIDSNLLHWH